MKLKTFVSIALLGLMFIGAIYIRSLNIEKAGNDRGVFIRATTDFSRGINIYINGVQSFEESQDTGSHGYSYLPGIFYVDSSLYVLSVVTGWSTDVLWKIPVLLADIGVGLLLVKLLSKKSILYTLVAVAFWFFNPYSVLYFSYTYFDPIPIFFALLALYFLEKDDVLAGAFFACAILFKVYPVFLLPVFLLLAKNKVKFLTASFMVGVFFCLPFLKSINDLMLLIRGSFLVHGERVVQGRPFLFYISYYYQVITIQRIPTSVLAMLAILGGWFFEVLAWYFFNIKNKWILSLFAYINFYIFTPVLNRTYTLWFLPVFLLAAQRYIKNKYILYGVLLLTWVFFYWYLYQWQDGFEIRHP